MDLRDYQAYAAASWNRFDHEVTDRLLRAVAGSFAWIACADGHLAQSEVESFVKAVIAQDTLPKLPAKTLEGAFRQLCEAMFTDVEGGRARALEAALAVKEDPEQAALVAQTAELAMLSDGRVREAEQEALRKLCEALGVDLAALRARRG